MPSTRHKTKVVLLAIVLAAGPAAHSETGSFRRGDSNADGRWDISDASFTLNFLFLGGPPPACQDSADTNDDGQVDMSDAVWLLWFLFNGAAAPPPPAGFCGIDPTPDELTCAGYSTCPPVDFAPFVLSLIATGSSSADPVSINDLNLCFDENAAVFEVLCPSP